MRFALAFSSAVLITFASSQAEQVDLKFAQISAPATVLSRPEASRNRMSSGIIFPQNNMSMSSSDWQEIRLGKSVISVRATKAEKFELKHQGGIVTLERGADGMGYKPFVAQLGGGRQHALAFPYGYVSVERTWLFGAKRPSGFLFYRSGGVQQAMVDGQTLAIYDHNTDGNYRIADDSFTTAPADATYHVFAPLAKHICLDKGAYQITRLAEDGGQIELTPVAGATGKLTVAFGGEMDVQCAFAATDAEAAMLAIARPGQPATHVAAPGKYAVVYGMVYSPALKRPVALVEAGGSRPVELAANQSATIEMGAPFKFAFTFQRQNNTLQLNSSGFQLTGKAGEAYTSYEWSKEPEISLLAGGKSIPIGKMRFG